MAAKARKQSFEFVEKHDSGIATTGKLSLAGAHARLGKHAGLKGLELHIHEGEWVAGSYSTAYNGGDALMGMKAAVRLEN